VLVHVLKLCELDKDAFATALRRPKQQQPSPTASSGSSGSDALSCAVLRKLERHLASCRGVAMVFGDDEETA
jgi:endonuclease/exonuclease/phosphatase (EEP) superfamily protein YafD